MKSKRKKIIELIFIAIVASCVFELCITKILNIYSTSSIDRIVVIVGILIFIGLHMIIGIKKLYDFIIRYRYPIGAVCIIVFTLLQYSGSSNGALSYWVLEPEKDNTIWGIARGIHSDEYALETLLAISQKSNHFAYMNRQIRGIPTDVFSVVHPPVKDILSIGKIFNIGYYFLSSGMGLAFWWNLRWIALLLVSFEFCMLLTDGKKGISVCGTILIAFSGACQWWFTNAFLDILIFGQLAVILLNRWMTAKSFKVRFISIIGISWAVLSYIFTFYPAYMVSFGYIFVALAIWIIIKNRTIYQINLKDGLMAIGCIAIVGVLCFRYYHLSKDTLNIIANMIYPGKRIETGGKGFSNLFSYLYNFLLPFIQTNDNYAMANIISIFPIPMLIGLYCLYQKQEHLSFLLPTVMVAVLETVFCMLPIPETVANITLLRFVPVERMAVAVGFVNIYIFLYWISHLEKEFFTMKAKIRISVIVMCIVPFLALPEKVSSKGFILLFAGILCVLTFLFLNFEDKRYKYALLGIMIILTLSGSVFVHPITKGISSITETKLAKKIQDIVSQDKEALWMSEDTMMVVANYAMANGAKTINATNIYPYTDLLKTVLGEEMYQEKETIWNRYAHVQMTLDTQNDVILIDKDKIELHVTAEKLQELHVQYMISYHKQEELEQKGIKLKEVYSNHMEKPIELEDNLQDSIYIYEIVSDL